MKIGGQTASGEEMICLTYYELRKGILHSHKQSTEESVQSSALDPHSKRMHQSEDYQENLP